MPSWKEVTIKTPENVVDAVSNFLFEIGSSGVVTEDTILNDHEDSYCNVKGYFSDNYNFSSIHSQISLYLQSLKSIGVLFSPGQVIISDIKDQDFSESWKEHFKTIEIGNRLVVKPVWETCHFEDDKICVELNPSRAFGTGGHPTTRLCLRLIEEVYTESVSSMLDIGCGSGILSIYGSIIGIKSVTGVDIDPIAIDESLKNAEINHVQNHIKFIEGDLKDIPGVFDLIVANIYCNTICRMIPVFKEKLLPDGNLIVSGITDDQVDTVLDFAKQSSFKLIKEVSEENWSALQLCHK